MNVHVCMYVCVLVVMVCMWWCMCVCMYVCVCVYVCTYVGDGVYVCMNVIVCVCMYVCVYVYIYVCVCMYVYVYVLVCVYVCQCVYVCMCVYVYVCMCMYVCVCVYTCIVIMREWMACACAWIHASVSVSPTLPSCGLAFPATKLVFCLFVCLHPQGHPPMPSLRNLYAMLVLEVGLLGVPPHDAWLLCAPKWWEKTLSCGSGQTTKLPTTRSTPDSFVLMPCSLPFHG